jgi:hypothetical protein
MHGLSPYLHGFRRNHYDYEGPRELLRKGSEFKAVVELYHDEGVFSLRVKQIV